MGVWLRNRGPLAQGRHRCVGPYLPYYAWRKGRAESKVKKQNFLEIVNRRPLPDQEMPRTKESGIFATHLSADV
jgi:hypothetical protein